jgi:hypothetical protein
MMKFDDLRATIERLRALLAERGRAGDPFEFQAVCIRPVRVGRLPPQGDIGVTDVLTVPWVFDGVAFDAEVGPKRDSIKKFGDEIISKF